MLHWTSDVEGAEKLKMDIKFLIGMSGIPWYISQIYYKKDLKK